MGVGKSYWAKRLSDKCGMDHFDTDEEVEKELQATVQRIIEEKGLRVFRQKEKEVLRRIISSLKNDAIVSLGGGTLLDPDSLELVQKSGQLVWLKAKARTLKSEEIEKRPLFDKENMQDLYLERKEAYLEADFIVDLDEYENEAEIEYGLSRYLNP